eukprot:TRINITY_DN6087_c0_g1_i1.p1 TRINITY_DN6087_c0_g1~~TRINITY_DN6087_c0_g1_i1.p1  ORF type:complete len:566 (+),score=104.97 TRINITY_DN6087_c0_g1_i1:71-1768(+)
MSKRQSAPLLRLCDDAVLLVAVHLTFYERLQYLKTHRRFWGVLKRSLPRSINMCNTSPEVVLGVLAWIRENCTHVRSLNLHGHSMDGISQAILQNLGECRSLEVFNIQHCKEVGDEVVQLVADRSEKTLRQISLWDTGSGRGFISKSVLLELITKCKNLEILDFRGQKNVDDDVMEALGKLKKLRKVALSGTRGSGYAFSKLVSDCSGTLTRIGCFSLRLNGVAQLPPVIASPVLEELQIGYPHHALPLQVDITRLPKLKFLGVCAMHQLDTFIDWGDVVNSNVTQIMANGYNRYPPNFLRCLGKIAPRLRYLSLSEVKQPEFASIIPACVELRQLCIGAVDSSMLHGIAKLPNLQYLNLASQLADSELEEFYEIVEREEGQLFPCLTNVFFGSDLIQGAQFESDKVAPEQLAKLFTLMPNLTGLYISCTPEQLLHVFSSVNARKLRSLSLCSSMGDPATVLPVIQTMTELTRLTLCSTDLQRHYDAILNTVGCLPSLKVLGPNRAESFRDWDLHSSWHKVPYSGRWIRLHDPYGYEEQDGIKPFDQFITFLEEDIDPVYPVMEP